MGRGEGYTEETNMQLPTFNPEKDSGRAFQGAGEGQLRRQAERLPYNSEASRRAYFAKATKARHALGLQGKQRRAEPRSPTAATASKDPPYTFLRNEPNFGGILVGLDAAKRKTNPLLGVSEWWRQAERWLYRPIL